MAIALFSGGKDSTYSIYRASDEYDISTLISVKANTGSRMYHVPGISVTSLIAENINKKIKTVRVEKKDEITPLLELIKKINPDEIITGAVESNYQKNRIEKICDEVNAECVTPIWNSDPIETLEQMIEKFKIMIVAVAADGLDEKWLGRILDQQTLEELKLLSEKKGIHMMGEGGEYETLVLAGENMNGEIKLDYEKEWDGIRGKINIKNAEIEN